MNYILIICIIQHQVQFVIKFSCRVTFIMKFYAFIIAVLCFNEIEFNLASVLSNLSISDVCDSQDKICLWKCCPLGQTLRRKNCVSTQINLDFSNLTLYDKQLVITNKSFEDVFQTVYGIMADTNFNRNAYYVGFTYNTYLMEVSLRLL